MAVLDGLLDLDLSKFIPDLMAREIFGKPYAEIQDLLYPAVKYHTFLINKKNGGQRIISAPNKKLKRLQRLLLDFLVKTTPEFRSCVHGFIEDRSIVTNAKEHCTPKTTFVLNIDLKDFFPSITFKRVRGMFMKFPFNYHFSTATVLAQMTCLDGTLPQGAPTSPFISNLICRGLDRQLVDIARRNGARYSRYCDDITFSFTKSHHSRLPSAICEFDGAQLTLGLELRNLITEHGFSINEEKVRISGPLRRKEVTGLTINQFPNVRRKFVDEIRGALNAWKTHGYVAAEAVWKTKPYHRQRRKADRPPLHNVLRGKLLYLKAVRSSDDVLYNRLAEKFNQLVQKTTTEISHFKCASLPVVTVVRSAKDVNSAVFVLELEATDETSQEFLCGQGTAFSFGDYGIVTCDHVIRYDNTAIPAKQDGPYYHLIPGAKLTLKHPPTLEEWPAKVLTYDAHRDIALLDFIGEKPKFLENFSSFGAQARKHDNVHLLGFPNWQTSKREYTHDQGRVIGHLKSNSYERIEINTLIRQGNSGGPLVDELFRVVGMAQKGAKQDSGNNECLCVTEMEKWLKSVTGE